MDNLAVVTGGGSGIGRACVEKLRSRAIPVVVVDINLEAAQAVASRTGSVAYAVDVSLPNDVEALAARIERELGRVDKLVNSAGIIQPQPDRPEDLSFEVWDRVIDVDLKGTYAACVAFGKRMARGGRGAIVNIASVTGIRSAPLHAYSPAKAAVAHLTRCLAAEWGRSGVRVNAVSPGYTLTESIKDAIDRGLRDVRRLEDFSAIGRMVMPHEIANAVDFLLSDEAAAITGVNLPVDNGWLVGTSWETYGGLRSKQAVEND